MNVEDDIAAKYGLEKPSVQGQPLKKLLNGDFGAAWSVGNSGSDYAKALILMILIGLTITLFIIYKVVKNHKSKE